MLPVLARLGLADEVRKAAYPPDDLQLLDAYSGQTLFRIPLKGAAFEQRFAAPYIAIHRVDLHEIQLRACRRLPNIDLNQATTVTSFTQDGDSVQVHAADGRSITGSALIAADGLRSRLRAQLHPADTWRDTGYAAYRTIVSRDEAPQSMRNRRGVTMLTADGFHVIYYPLRGGSEINVVGVFQVRGGIDATEAAHHDFVKALTAHAVPEVHDVISVLNLTRRWSIADREPVRRWHQGRMTLLGDAAHATLQSLAQGAGMALEDAVTLGDLMAAHPADPTRAFAQFERERFLHTTRWSWSPARSGPCTTAGACRRKCAISNCRNDTRRLLPLPRMAVATEEGNSMKLCRFNGDRLGLVDGDQVIDVTAALDVLPPVRWQVPLGDPLVNHLACLVAAVQRVQGTAKRLPLSAVRLNSPLTNPGKVMAAPANYRLHVEQDTKDAGVDQGVHRKALQGVERPTETYGLFLEAISAIVGPAEGVQVILPERRTDHEVELAVVIGKPGHSIPRAEAKNHVAGYCIGMDMTVRGAEDRSFSQVPGQLHRSRSVARHRRRSSRPARADPLAAHGCADHFTPKRLKETR